MTPDSSEERFAGLNTGWLCLDFANTADWHASEHPLGRLTDYEELVNWSRHAGILTDGAARKLLREAVRRPAQAAQAFERGIALREALYRVFSAGSRGQRPAEADLATVNSAVADAMARSQIVPSGEGFVWDWTGNGHDLDSILWPVARSAADLLTSDDLKRVGECADDRGCGWLFLDRSRNHSRRWCAMQDCGNRAKARRHYQRRKVLA